MSIHVNNPERPRQAEAGFSLTEVLVATLIMGMVMGALFTGLEQTEVFYESYESAMTLRQQARVTIATMADELRSAGYDMGDASESVSIADSNQLQFTGDIDNGDEGGPCDGTYENSSGGGAERVTYSVDGDNNLIRTIDCFDGSTWTVGVETATVLSGLQPDLQIFQYMDVSGMLLPTDAGALSAALRGDVRSVEVNLILQNLDQKVGAGNDIPDWFRLRRHVRMNNLENLEDVR